MEFLKFFETENEYMNEKDSFEYPQVSFTNDNGKVWVKDEENYILATYLWDVTDENATPENTEFYVSSLYDNERPFFIEREELISINEEGHATFKLHLYKETKIYPISLEESFWGGSGMYGMYCVPLIHVDFSNSYIILESIPKNMFPAKIESIIFGDNFDTSNVTSMREMFDNCADLTSITFGDKFITSNVTSMVSMFGNCQSLTSIDLSLFDTSNVTSMSAMFYECRSLTSLDLSSFDLFNVTIIEAMFYNCYNLNSIEFGNLSYISNIELYNDIFKNVPSSCTLTLCSNTQTSWDVLLTKIIFNGTVNYKTCEEPNE